MAFAGRPTLHTRCLRANRRKRGSRQRAVYVANPTRWPAALSDRCDVGTELQIRSLSGTKFILQNIYDVSARLSQFEVALTVQTGPTEKEVGLFKGWDQEGCKLTIIVNQAEIVYFPISSRHTDASDVPAFTVRHRKSPDLAKGGAGELWHKFPNRVQRTNLLGGPVIATHAFIVKQKHTVLFFALRHTPVLLQERVLDRFQ